ncbi:MAG: RNA polymerase sigma factor [Bryobacteraceae bacterium]|nr:RNA polymerase sigma factor [Bryobacteraceae bacterium]
MTEAEFAAGYQAGFFKTIQFLRSRGISSDADEFAQAAWVRGWERRDQIRNPTALLVWINTIALNLWRESNRHPVVGISVLGERASPPQNLIAVLEVARRMKACSAEQRTLLEGFYLNGDSVQDIANRTACSEVAVRIRLHRARQRLAQVGRPERSTGPCRSKTPTCVGVENNS